MEWYCEVGVGNPHDRGYSVRLGVAFQAAHKAIRRHGGTVVGLSFPEWKAAGEKQKAGLGNHFYIVSTDLEALTRVVQALRCSEAGLETTAMTEVPQGAERAIFARSRTHQRYFHHRLHGDSEGKQKAEERLGSLAKVPCVKVTSSSNGNSFWVAIDRRSPDQGADQTGFNSYGLSSGASVPVF